MVDQVHGMKFEESEPVIKRPMTQQDILEFRNALVKSYNPLNDPKGVQKNDFRVQTDEDYLYFLMKTDKKDKDNKEVWRIIFKYRKWDEKANAAKKQQTAGTAAPAQTPPKR